MGYVRKRTIYRLVFEDSDLAGLEVRVGSMSTGQLMDLTRAAARLAGKIGGGAIAADDLEPDDLEALDLLFGSLADALVEWNLETCPHGECPGPGACIVTHDPVPATLAGIRTQDSPFTLRLVTEWMKAAGGVPDPLPGPSTAGATSLEASLPMEVLSTSR